MSQSFFLARIAALLALLEACHEPSLTIFSVGAQRWRRRFELGKRWRRHHCRHSLPLPLSNAAEIAGMALLLT